MAGRAASLSAGRRAPTCTPSRRRAAPPARSTDRRVGWIGPAGASVTSRVWVHLGGRHHTSGPVGAASALTSPTADAYRPRRRAESDPVTRRQHETATVADGSGRGGGREPGPPDGARGREDRARVLRASVLRGAHRRAEDGPGRLPARRRRARLEPPGHPARGGLRDLRRAGDAEGPRSPDPPERSTRWPPRRGASRPTPSSGRRPQTG